jgi:hypothetical protein
MRNRAGILATGNKAERCKIVRLRQDLDLTLGLPGAPWRKTTTYEHHQTRTLYIQAIFPSGRERKDDLHPGSFIFTEPGHDAGGRL